MRCPNCGKTEFELMGIIDDQCTEGYVRQLVEAYTCLNCGRIELYMPQELINKRIEQKRKQAEQKQAEENRKREEVRLRTRMQELELFLQDENHTLKELKEAQKELTEIQNKLHIQFRRTYIKL